MLCSSCGAFLHIHDGTSNDLARLPPSKLCSAPLAGQEGPNSYRIQRFLPQTPNPRTPPPNNSETVTVPCPRGDRIQHLDTMIPSSS